MASQQTQQRPWLRRVDLGSRATTSDPPPAQTQSPAPRPTLLGPTFRTPPTQQQQATSAPLGPRPLTQPSSAPPSRAPAPLTLAPVSQAPAPPSLTTGSRTPAQPSSTPFSRAPTQLSLAPVSQASTLSSSTPASQAPALPPSLTPLRPRGPQPSTPMNPTLASRTPAPQPSSISVSQPSAPPQRPFITTPTSSAPQAPVPPSSSVSPPLSTTIAPRGSIPATLRAPRPPPSSTSPTLSTTTITQPSLVSSPPATNISHVPKTPITPARSPPHTTSLSSPSPTPPPKDSPVSPRHELRSPLLVPTPLPSREQTLVATPSMPMSLPKPSSQVRAQVKPLPETPPHSPISCPTTHAPPSPFRLPPSQLKEPKSPPLVEKRIVDVHQTVAKPKSFTESFAKPAPGEHIFNNSDDDDEGGMRVVTIAGENKGAIMELDYSSPQRNPHGYTTTKKHVKFQDHRELSSGLSDNASRSRMEGKHPNGFSKNQMSRHAVMNSNVQGVNSSILFNSSFSHHDPGVHFSLSGNPTNGYADGHAS